MKTTLGMAIAVAAMMLSAGFANAAVGSNVASLRTLSTNSSIQTAHYYHHHHYYHRHCWWRHGHRHCG